MTANKTRWLVHLSFEKGSWVDCYAYHETLSSIKVQVRSKGVIDAGEGHIGTTPG